jgi:hypothetical protein
VSAQEIDRAPDAEAVPLRLAWWVGVVVMGVVMGFALLPAILELLSLVGNVKAFKYQNF